MPRSSVRQQRLLVSSSKHHRAAACLEPLPFVKPQGKEQVHELHRYYEAP